MMGVSGVVIGGGLGVVIMKPIGKRVKINGGNA
jgi:hypothetical protein